jgi:hypothetical protein
VLRLASPRDCSCVPAIFLVHIDNDDERDWDYSAREKRGVNWTAAEHISLMEAYGVVTFDSICYTRSNPSYKLLSEYNLLLTQRLTSYPLVLGVLYCGSSSFASVTNELSLGVLWLLCVSGNSFARSTAQLSCPPLSLSTQLSESKAAFYIDNPAALTL